MFHKVALGLCQHTIILMCLYGSHQYKHTVEAVYCNRKLCDLDAFLFLHGAAPIGQPCADAGVVRRSRACMVKAGSVTVVELCP